MKLINFLFISLLLINSINSYASELITLNTREGAQQKFILIKPEKPAVASVILFIGGHGALGLSSSFGSPSIDWGTSNILYKNRQQFADSNFNVAIVDAPSDHQEKPGMLFGFRDSDEHVNDIDHVISYLNKQSNVPIWLVGISRGTESVATVAIDTPKKPHGIVLLSPMSAENPKGTAVNEMALEKIKMPTLILAHEDDGCHVTPPEGAEEIKTMLTSAKKVEVKMFTGGDETGHPCKAKSFHGFLDIEEKVINYIAGFIKSN